MAFTALGITGVLDETLMETGGNFFVRNKMDSLFVTTVFPGVGFRVASGHNYET